MSDTSDRLFADLPAGLLEEILTQTGSLAAQLLGAFEDLRSARSRIHADLDSHGLITNDSSYGYPPIPTSCAVDGSYGIERLLSTDLAACAAVAMEGLAPPSEKRHWEEPRHVAFVRSEMHRAETATVLRSVMIGEELRLAARAPHDLVLFDGTLALPTIYFNQGLNSAQAAPELQCSGRLLHAIADYLTAYELILRSDRSDRQYVGLPKYSTRREFGRRFGWPTHYDDRGLLSLVLTAGQLTKPVQIEAPGQPWHITTTPVPQESRASAVKSVAEVVAGLEKIHIFYYKPHDWLPALRVEVAQSIASNRHRLAIVLQGLKHQCATPGILEPYPNYIADRMVKALAGAVPALRQVATQKIAEQYSGDVGEIFFGMHGYRTERER